MSLPPYYISYSHSSITTTVHVSVFLHPQHYSTYLSLPQYMFHTLPPPPSPQYMSHTSSNTTTIVHISHSPLAITPTIYVTLSSPPSPPQYMPHILSASSSQRRLNYQCYAERGMRKYVPDDVRTEIDTTLESLRDTHLLDAKRRTSHKLCSLWQPAPNTSTVRPN